MTEYPTCHMCEHWERGVCSYHSKRVPGNCRACIYGHAKPEYRTPAPKQYRRVKLPTNMPVPEPGKPRYRAHATYRDHYGVLQRRVDSAKLKRLIHEWSSQRALARCLDTSAETVSRWVNRYHSVPEDQVRAIAATIGCLPSDFARGWTDHEPDERPAPVVVPKPPKPARGKRGAPPTCVAIDPYRFRDAITARFKTVGKCEAALGFRLCHELRRGLIAPERLRIVCKLLDREPSDFTKGR